MVERVIVTGEGQVRQLEWKPPFSYMQQRRDNQMGGQDTSKTTTKARTSAVSAGSIPGSFGGPGGIQSEPSLSDFDDPLRFVELTAYPQRSALEPLLTIQ